ncbi:MAG TPA: hypothetical protein VFG45_04570 [Candidatus Nitrosocosmicus sp.]|nr:hypothetical protein [Candidatus Nitrosocosmicus sp.]
MKTRNKENLQCMCILAYLYLYFSGRSLRKIRVYLLHIKDALVSRKKFQIRLVDVRSPAEYNRDITAPPKYPTEHAQRAGHNPAAQNVPWTQVLN